MRTFEEVWRILKKELPDETVETLVQKEPNRILKLDSRGMSRRTQKSAGTGWKPAKHVPKSEFKRIWDPLSRDGYCDIRAVGGWAIAAACLVYVQELGVEKARERPLTLRLR